MITLLALIPPKLPSRLPRRNCCCWWLYTSLDDVQATAIGALRGYKDTRNTFVVAVVAHWFVGLPISVVLGFGLFESIIRVFTATGSALSWALVLPQWCLFIVSLSCR